MRKPLQGAVAIALAASLTCLTPAAAIADDADGALANAAVSPVSEAISVQAVEVGAAPQANYDVVPLFLDTYGLNPSDVWFIREGWLDYVVDNNLIKGIADGPYAGMFRYDDPITRAQVALIIYRAAGEPDYSQPTSFVDVMDPTAYYYDAVMWCASEGIVTGYQTASGQPTGLFGPDDYVERQQLATMLGRLAEYGGIDNVGDHESEGMLDAPDADSIQEYARGYMAWCYDNDVLTGSALTGKLDPLGQASRAAMAKMITVTLRDVFDLGSLAPTTQVEREQAFLSELREAADQTTTPNNLVTAELTMPANDGRAHSFVVTYHAVDTGITADYIRSVYGVDASETEAWNDIRQMIIDDSAELYSYSVAGDVDVPVIARFVTDDNVVACEARNGVETLSIV